MNFGENVKRELMDNIAGKVDNIIILSAVIHSIGSIGFDRKGITLELQSENSELLSLVKKMLDCFGADYRSILKCTRKREQETVIVSPQASVELLKTGGILYDYNGELALSLGIDPEQIRNDDDLRLYLAGVFLGAGALFVPSYEGAERAAKQSGYSMEFVLSSYDFASDLVELIKRKNCCCHITERKERYVVYVKDSQTISDLLALMGAQATVLELNNIMVLGAVRNNINRQSNCLIANAAKTADASIKQINAIRYIDEKIGLDKLPENLIKVAKARLENPESPLNEISQSLNIGKSGVNHRFRRILAIAEELRQAEQDKDN